MDELLRTSGLENESVLRSLKHWVNTLSQSEVEAIELSGERQRGVIRLEELIRGDQQIRFQEHSIRALRCGHFLSVVMGKAVSADNAMRHFPLLPYLRAIPLGKQQRIAKKLLTDGSARTNLGRYQN